MTQRKAWIRELVITGLVAVGLGVAPNAAPGQTRFTVRIENVADQPLMTSKGPVPFTLSPGAWAVHTAPDPIFTAREPARGNGLEEIAEDGKPASKLAKALKGMPGVRYAGAFTTPESKMEKGGLKPGMMYEFTIMAMPGDRFSFATMFAESNDLFYAPEQSIPLFRNGEPIRGDVTSMVGLWDAGTEVNQEPGVGPAQPHRQPRLGYGPAESETVRPISVVTDGFTYPRTNQVMRVTITPKEMVRKDGR